MFAECFGAARLCPKGISAKYGFAPPSDESLSSPYLRLYADLKQVVKAQPLLQLLLFLYKLFQKLPIMYAPILDSMFNSKDRRDFILNARSGAISTLSE